MGRKIAIKHNTKRKIPAEAVKNERERDREKANGHSEIAIMKFIEMANAKDVNFNER